MVNNVNLFIQLNVARKFKNLPLPPKVSAYFQYSILDIFQIVLYGAECLYIHPPCRFAGACTRSDCPYLHSTATPASSPNENASNTGRSSITNRSESSTVSLNFNHSIKKKLIRLDL